MRFALISYWKCDNVHWHLILMQDVKMLYFLPYTLCLSVFDPYDSFVILWCHGSHQLHLTVTFSAYDKLNEVITIFRLLLDYVQAQNICTSCVTLSKNALYYRVHMHTSKHLTSKNILTWIPMRFTQSIESKETLSQSLNRRGGDKEFKLFQRCTSKGIPIYIYCIYKSLNDNKGCVMHDVQGFIWFSLSKYLRGNCL